MFSAGVGDNMVNEIDLFWWWRLKREMIVSLNDVRVTFSVVWRDVEGGISLRRVERWFLNPDLLRSVEARF